MLTNFTDSITNNANTIVQDGPISVACFPLLFFPCTPPSHHVTSTVTRENRERERERESERDVDSRCLTIFLDTSRLSNRLVFPLSTGQQAHIYVCGFPPQPDQAAGVNCKVQQNTDPSEPTRSRQLYRVYQILCAHWLGCAGTMTVTGVIFRPIDSFY